MQRRKKILSHPPPKPSRWTMPAPATTTEEEDLTKLGQRRVNILWELTQGVIAISITGAIIYCQVNKIESQILNNAFFLIVSMYYVRTNHQLIGGVGPKPLPENQQR